jgi:hypothetical protein
LFGLIEGIGFTAAAVTVGTDSPSSGTYNGSCPKGGAATFTFTQYGTEDEVHNITLSSCAFNTEGGISVTVTGAGEGSKGGNQTIHFSISGTIGFAANCDLTDKTSGQCVFTDSTGTVISMTAAEASQANAEVDVVPYICQGFGSNGHC